MSSDGIQPLAVREALLEEAERVAGLGSWVWDVATNQIEWSNNLFRMMGHEPQSFTPTLEDFFARIHPDDLERVKRTSAEVAANAVAPVMEYRIRRVDGTTWICLANGRAVRDGKGALIRMVGTLTDVTDLRRQHREHERIQRILASAQQIASIGAWSWLPETGQIRWTDELFAITGLARDAELSVKSFDNLVHPDDLPLLQAARRRVLSGELTPAEAMMTVRIVRPAGDIRWVEMAGRQGENGELIGIVADVTRRRRLEDELLKSRTLESTGRLAAGIAHDFNNLLTVVVANTKSLIEQGLASPEIQEIQDAALSGATLVEHLLAFGRHTDREPRIIDLSAHVEQASRWIQRVIGDDVRITCRLKPNVRIHADPAELHRVLLNLSLNARDAMTTGGTLRLELDREERSAVLRVGDTGGGMDRETLSRAADPFFTTKPEGEGSGLGLSTVYGCIRQLGGTMHIESERQLGTVVEIRLPLVEQAQPKKKHASIPATAERRPLRVLLVEDNRGVRRALKRQLNHAQHLVQEAEDAQAALTLLREVQVDIVLTDWSMPGGGGERLLREIRKGWPGLPVVVMSGFLPTTTTIDAPLLRKPFEPRTLLKALDDAMTPPVPV